MQPPTDSSSSATPAPNRNWAGVLVVGLVFLWILGTSMLTQSFGWMIDEILQLNGESWPKWGWTALSMVQAILLLVPLLPLAFVWPDSRYRAVFQVWALAAVFAFISAPIRFVQPPAVLAANVLQILTALSASIALLLLLWFHGKADQVILIGDASIPWLALLFVALLMLPWLAWGALGSLLDSVLNLAAGVAFGLASALLLTQYLLLPLRRTSDDHRRNVPLGTLSAGAALLIMASGYGYNGTQLILMISVPALGFLLAILGQLDSDSVSGGWLPLAILVGIATAAPMMLIDSNELTLFLALGTRDLLYWAFYGAVVAMLIAWFLGLALFLLQRQIHGLKRRLILAGAVGSWLVAAGVYVVFGQPGFHGDQLFVILKEQADFSQSINDLPFESRRQAVYEELVELASRSQADLRDDLDRLGIGYSPYYLVNGLSVDGGPFVRFWLESRPDVDHVVRNPILRPLPASGPGLTGSAKAPSRPEWNLELIGANRVWEEFGITGEGIVIGQSDTGVEGSHRELAANYRGRTSGSAYNWFDPWNLTSEPTDNNGHGTHTLGSIVGANTGVAPGAEWFGCVNLDRNLANPAFYLDCMQFMLAPFPAEGDPFSDGEPDLSAHVVNNSWGCPQIEGCDPNTLLFGARALRAAGIFVVASAGNDGPECGSVRNPLAIYEDAFSVGAIDSSGALADFSSRGPVTVDGSGRTKPDIVAPGVDILSAFRAGSYEYLPGTSMAGPHVAGTVALMWSANPELIGDVERTEQILTATAQKYRGPLTGCSTVSDPPFNSVGYGVLDAYSAVKEALALR